MEKVLVQVVVLEVTLEMEEAQTQRGRLALVLEAVGLLGGLLTLLVGF
jgi:hypothetical protein